MPACKRGLTWILGLGAALRWASGAETTLFQDSFENGLMPRWKKVEFAAETQHRINRTGTNSFVEAIASGSASGLAVQLESLPSNETHLRWRWRIDHIPQGGSDSQLKTFDHTARLFVAFKTLIGPPKSINYVWANELPVSKTFEHPSSGRSRFMVLESGNSKAGEWITEERDLAADWTLLFGDDKPPALVGLGIMTDSDGTKTTVTGCYDDIELGRRK